MVAPVPIRIRGVTYPSMQKAADALGVTRQAIQSALDRGELDNVGIRKAALMEKYGYDVWKKKRREEDG